jgi:hypothetical protein
MRERERERERGREGEREGGREEGGREKERERYSREEVETDAGVKNEDNESQPALGPHM